MSGGATLLCLAAVAAWLAGAAAIGLMAPRHRGPALWGAALAGIPLVGWATYGWGPGPGVAAFLLGLVALLRAPGAAAAWRRRRPRPAATGGRGGAWDRGR